MANGNRVWILNQVPGSTLNVSILGDGFNCCDQPKPGDTYGPANYLKKVELDYCRTDGHGCNGRQGQFVASITVGDKSDQQQFNFDSDGGLQLGDPSPKVFSGLLSNGPNGSYIYVVMPLFSATETVESASAVTGA